MAEEIGSLAVSMSMDASDFNGTISQINRNMRAMGGELQAVRAMGNDYANSIDGLTQRQDILQRSVDAASLKLREQRQRYDELVASGNATEAQIERQAIAVNQAQAQYNRLNTELRNVSDELADATNSWRQAGSSISEFGERASAVGGKLKDVGGSLTASLTAPIVAFGAAALTTATQFDTAQAKIQGQLGITAAEAERLSGVAQEVWKKGFGEDVIQVTSDLATLKHYVKDVGDQELSNLLESGYMLNDLFGADIQESARTASVMMKTFGIDGQTAMDLITVGFQRGGDFSGELLDTLREYSPQFKALGYDAEAFTAILIAGAESGAFNLDKVGDSAKESFLKIGEGSKGTRDALEALGLNFQQIEKDISSGGETANSAFAAVVSAISTVQDPAEKSRLAIALMGTPIEDLGPEFQNFFANVSTELVGFEGAASKAAETLQQSFGERLQSTWRTAQESLLPLGETLLDIAEDWLPKISGAIETVTGRFSEMSPGAQNAALAIGGIAAIAGPVIAGVGMIASGIGAISAVTGPVVASIGGFGAAAGTAGASAGVFGGAIAALSGPVGWAALGIAAVGTAALVVADELSEASLSVEDWTSKVSEATAETLGSFMELGEQATLALNQLAWSGQTVTTEMAASMISIYDQMGQQVLAEMQTDHAAQLQQMTDHFAQSIALTETEEAEILATMQSKASEKEAVIAEGQARITEIYNTAAAENRAITEAEQTEINAIQQTMTENAIVYMTESQVEQKAILETLKSEASAITAEMAAEVVQNAIKQKDEVIAEAEDQYSQVVEAIIRQRDEMGTISAEQADKLIEEAQRQRDDTIAAAEEMHQNVVTEAQAQADEHVSKVDWATGEIKSKWQVLKENVVQAAKDIGTGVKNDFSEMYQHTANRVNEIKEAASTKFNEMKQAVSNKMIESKQAIETKWKEAETFLRNINLKQIGRDVISGLINGIGEKVSGVKTKIEELAANIPAWAKNILGIKSPSRVMMEVGRWTGEGLAVGLDGTKGKIQQSIEDVGYLLIDAAEHFANEEIRIKAEANSEIEKLTESSNEKIAKLEETTASKISSIKKKAIDKKRALTSDEISQITKLEQELSKNIIKINEETAEKTANIQAKSTQQIVKNYDVASKEYLDTITKFVNDKKSLDQLSVKEEAAIWKQTFSVFEEGSDERIKAQQNYQKAIESARKEEFDSVKTHIADLKSQNQLSLVGEAEIWRAAIDNFEAGSKERLDAQNAYKSAVDSINKEVESINKKHQGEMQKIIDEDIKMQEAYSNEYINALNKRKGELLNFAGIFDQVVVDTKVTGQQLMENLASQVVALEDWSTNLQVLASRGVNDGLLAELKALGPKALSEIAALTQLTDEQLQTYEALWQEKSAMATELAVRELEPLKSETDQKIAELHASTESKLDALAKTWQSEIQGITSSVESGLVPLESIGSSAVDGLIAGLADKAPALQAKASEIANSITETMRAALQINSPSKKSQAIAAFVGDGLIAGLKNKVASIKQTATNVAQNLLSAISTNKKDGQTAGSNLMNGFADGVKSSTAKLTQDIKDQVRESMYQTTSTISSAISATSGGVASAIESAQKVQSDLDAKIKEKYNEFGLFDQARVGKIASSRLKQNLESQLYVMNDWKNNMMSLENRGVDAALIKELQEMGVSAAGEIKSLNSMSESELNEYVALWRTKTQMATEIAKYEMRDMSEIGKNAVQSMQSGLTSAAPALFTQVQSIANNVRETLGSAMNFASNNAVAAISNASNTLSAGTNNTTINHNTRSFAPTVTVYAQDSGASEMERTLTRMQYGLL